MGPRRTDRENEDKSKQTSKQEQTNKASSGQKEKALQSTETDVR
jgi:hypothetical protein